MLDEHTAALHLACYAAPASASPEERLQFGERALQRLIAKGLPTADGPHGPAVDGNELLNFCRSVGDEAWRHGMVSEFRRMCGLYESAMQRRARGEESRARFVLRHRRRWTLQDQLVGSPVRLSFELPIDDAQRRTVGVEVSESGGCRATVSPEAVVLRGVVPAERSIEAEIRIEAMLDCECPSTPAAPEPGLEMWLADDEPGIPCTDRVRELAREWTVGRETPREKIRAVWDELERRILPGFLNPEDAELDALELGWADCKMASSLLVALTRSLGIPARLVRGMMLVRERPCDFHFWMEAWLPDTGWTPFDWLATIALSELSDDPDRWRYWFFGRLDYRMIHTRYPARFAGITGVRLPAQWYRVETGNGGCLVREYRANEGGKHIFTDTFQIEELVWM